MFIRFGGREQRKRRRWRVSAAVFLNSSFRRLGTCEEFAFLLLQIKLLVEVGAKIGTKLRNPGFVVLVHVARRLVIDKAAEIVGTPEARRVIVHDLVGIEVAVPDGVGLADRRRGSGRPSLRS